jgi:hypothetical protein
MIHPSLNTVIIINDSSKESKVYSGKDIFVNDVQKVKDQFDIADPFLPSIGFHLKI